MNFTNALQALVSSEEGKGMVRTDSKTGKPVQPTRGFYLSTTKDERNPRVNVWPRDFGAADFFADDFELEL